MPSSFFRSANSKQTRARSFTVALLLCVVAIPVSAQPPQPGHVRMNLQGEVKLQALIDYVSQRLELPIIYSPEVGNRRIHVRTPRELPVRSLLPLLGAVLKSEKLALVEAEVPGFKRIVDAKEMVGSAQPEEASAVLARDGGATPVIQSFRLRHTSAKELAQLLRPFLTSPGSSLITLDESNILVVTDYASTVVQIKKLLEMVDQPRRDVTYEFYRVQHLEASKLADQVRAMLGISSPTGAKKTQGRPAGKRVGPALFEEPRTNEIVVVGTADEVREALALLKRFDVSLGLVTQVYRFRHIQAERFHKLAQGYLAEPDNRRLYSASVDADGNLLIVRATPEIHQRLAELLQQIDLPVETRQSPIRFYKLKNANVLDVLYTLLALQEIQGTSTVVGTETTFFGAQTGAALGSPLVPSIPASPFSQLRAPGGMPGRQGMARPGAATGTPGLQNTPLPLPPEEKQGVYDRTRQSRFDRVQDALSAQVGFGGTAVLPGGARVSADPTTNSLIMIAPPEVHEMYANLIRELDKRKPQVLIDAKIIAVDTSNNFELGVEVSGGKRTGVKRIFAFTSYGLSEIDPITGNLQILPKIGFNGTLVDPEVADVVVQALASHSRARVLASPRILVNDNSTGQLESVASVPFASVNASNTVSTTSKGGDEQAGTIITVTPHISEHDHLLLEFEVEFSTFVGQSQSSTLPPPRQIDRVGSTVTIPDGQTIIVGGLKRTGRTDSQSGLPFISEVPILRAVSSLQKKNHQTTSFFLFIRPIILRDDKFADLRYLSHKSAHQAEIRGEHPRGQPVMIEE